MTFLFLFRLALQQHQEEAYLGGNEKVVGVVVPLLFHCKKTERFSDARKLKMDQFGPPSAPLFIVERHAGPPPSILSTKKKFCFFSRA